MSTSLFLSSSTFLSEEMLPTAQLEVSSDQHGATANTAQASGHKTLRSSSSKVLLALDQEFPSSEELQDVILFYPGRIILSVEASETGQGPFSLRMASTVCNMSSEKELYLNHLFKKIKTLYAVKNEYIHLLVMILILVKLMWLSEWLQCNC